MRTIKSIIELEQYKQNPGALQFYRGESRCYDTPMMSGIYRNADGLSINELQKREREYFNVFKQKTASKEIKVQDPFSSNLKFHKEWFWLFQAQHLKHKTRLIDFTVDMNTALFFAVNDSIDDEQNGHFWIFNCPKEIKITSTNEAKLFNCKPLEIEQSYMINPVQYQSEEDFIGKRRMIRQMGRFFVQSFEDGFTPVFKQEKFKDNFIHFEIDAKSKITIREELAESCYSYNWIYFEQ